MWKASLAEAGSYVAGYLLFGILFLAMMTPGIPRDRLAMENVLMGGYMVCVYGLFNTIGFILVGIVPGFRRSHPSTGAPVLAFCCGAVSFLLVQTGAHLYLLRFLQPAPRIGSIVVFAAPGLLTGLIFQAVTSLRRNPETGP